MFPNLNKVASRIIRPSRSTARLDLLSNQFRVPVNNISKSFSVTPSPPVKMKEAIVRKGTNVEIIDSPIPTPGKDQVVIKVEYSGSNPKDW